MSRESRSTAPPTFHNLSNMNYDHLAAVGMVAVQ